MNAALTASALSHHRNSDAPGLTVLLPLVLAAGRLHEFCGSARRTLAAMAAGQGAGAVFWVAPSWTLGGPNPCGLQRFADPGRFLFLGPDRADDLYWVMEEVLRSGLISLVVADLPAPPGLTQVRRLHLAAETGSAQGVATTGIILTPDAGGAQGIESRWQFQPRHSPATGECWHLERLRARNAPRAAWSIRCADKGYAASPAEVAAA